MPSSATSARTSADENAKAFQIASTLRQFTEVWDIEATDDRGRALVDILRARLLRMPDGSVELGAGKLQRLREQPEPDKEQLEAVLGTRGPQTYQMVEDRARARGLR